jgi:tripartite-type tricarboxylate transporter receptor subunit TctC
MNVIDPVRRSLLALALLALPVAAPAQQAPYPDKPVRVVVAWPPGGLVDVLGRVLAEKLQASLGQPFVIENRAGAGGVIGADLVAKAPPDGYTLLLSTSALNMNAAMQQKLPFDVQADFQPVVVAATAPSILVVRNDLPVHNVRELIALAKSEPGKLTYASAGNGTPAHLSAELFKTMTGTDMVHVPYKGAPPAMVDQIAGRVDFHFANATVALPHIKTGKIRALAVTSATRSPLVPDIPTMAEAGVPGFEADQWIGFLAPRGTPKPVVDRLAGAITHALAQPDVKAALAKQGMDVVTDSTPERFTGFMKQDLAKWTDVVKRAHVKVD